MSPRTNTILLAAALAAGISAAALLGRGDVFLPAADACQEQIEIADRASPPAAPSGSAVTVAGRRARVDASEPGRDQSHPITAWVAGFEQVEGELSASEVAVVQSYLTPLLDGAARELDELVVDPLDPEYLAAAAKAVRRIELWKATERALRAGDYVISANQPGSWSNPPGVILQPFPTWKDGKSVTLLFELKLDQVPGLRDARQYEKDMEQFRLQEAARRYNSLANAEREQRYLRYRTLRDEAGSWDALPADVRAEFPFENQVREGSFLMGGPF